MALCLVFYTTRYFLSKQQLSCWNSVHVCTGETCLGKICIFPVSLANNGNQSQTTSQNVSHCSSQAININEGHDGPGSSDDEDDGTDHEGSIDCFFTMASSLILLIVLSNNLRWSFPLVSWPFTFSLHYHR